MGEQFCWLGGFWESSNFNPVHIPFSSFQTQGPPEFNGFFQYGVGVNVPKAEQKSLWTCRGPQQIM